MDGKSGVIAGVLVNGPGIENLPKPTSSGLLSMLRDREKQEDGEYRRCAKNERCKLRNQHSGRSTKIALRAPVPDDLDPHESIGAVTFIG